MKLLFFNPRPLVRALLGAAVFLTGAGCNRSNDQITVYRIPKETAPPSMLSQADNPAPPPVAANTVPVHWTAPPGWNEQPAAGFRKGSFLVHGQDGQTADVSVISFPAEAGGLLANVNRWRGQLKLAPITDVVQAGTPMEVGGRDMFFVDLASEQPIEKQGGKARILGGIFPAGGETWFFKMMGPEALVESQREPYKKFLQSVHQEGVGPAMAGAGPMNPNPGGSETNAPTPPPVEPEPGGPVQYSLPPGWTEKPLTPMRLASFKSTSPDGKETDISVVSLPGMAGGDLANVNRWRGQLQLAPIDENGLAKSAEHISANGHNFLLVDLVSEGPIKGQKERILAAILDEADHAWFIKMTGEDGTVAAQKSAFIDFLRGLKIP